MSASKLDHKELQRRLKEDDLQVHLQEFIENARTFFEQYGKNLMIGIAVVAVVAAAGFYYKVQSKADYELAQLTFANGMSLLNQDQYDQALEKFNSVLREHAGSQVAVQAHLMRGNCFYNMKRYDESLKEYQDALNAVKTPEEKNLIELAMIQAYRSLGQPENALKEVDALMASAKTDELKNQVLYLKGGCLEDLGRTDEAVQAYESIAQDSPWLNFALERLEWLKAQPVKAIQ
ncbi:MAG: tetratricopeptide repeat protein [bacterium]|nr:tetratricopeptide repeat protein [bacterium]